MNTLHAPFIHTPEPCEACFIVEARALFNMFWTVKEKHPNHHEDKLCLYMKFWRGRRMASRGDVMRCAINRSMYYNM